MLNGAHQEYSVGEVYDVADYDETDAAREDVVSYVMDLYEEYKTSSYRDEVIKAAEEGRKRYDGDRDEKTFPWDGCANYSLGVDAIVVDNLEPRLAACVIGKDRDIIEVIPNNPESAKYAKEIEAFAEWALTHNIKWQHDIPAWIHHLLLDGTLYIFPHYEEKVLRRGKRFRGRVLVDPVSMERIDEQRAAQMAALGIQPIEQFVDEIQPTDIRFFRVVNDYATINDVFGPDICYRWEDTPTIRRKFVLYEDLEALSVENGGPYINITEDLKRDIKYNRDSDSLPPGSNRDKAESEKTRGEIEIIEAYLKYDLGDGYDWCIIGIAVDSKTLIRKQYVKDVYYGFVGKPVFRLVIFPDHGKQFGCGIPHKIRHFSSAINDCVNQMIDSGTVQINPWFFYGSDVGMPAQIDCSPGAGNKIFGNGQSIVFPQLGVKAGAYIDFINLITAFLERLIAISSYASGAEDTVMGQGAGTASGMQMILQEGQIKHSYQAKPLKDQLSEIIKLDMMLYGWYLPDDAIMRIPGANDFSRVNLDALQGDYDFCIRISDSAYNQMMERVEAQELLALIGQLPFANQVQLVKDLLSAYDKKNVDSYLDPNFMAVIEVVKQNPEAMEVLQQYVQQKQDQIRKNFIGQQVADSVYAKDVKEQMLAPRMVEDLAKQAKKAAIKERISDQMEFESAVERAGKIAPRHIQQAMEKWRQRIANEIVEGAIGAGEINNG